MIDGIDMLYDDIWFMPRVHVYHCAPTYIIIYRPPVTSKSLSRSATATGVHGHPQSKSANLGATQVLCWEICRSICPFRFFFDRNNSIYIGNWLLIIAIIAILLYVIYVIIVSQYGIQLICTLCSVLVCFAFLLFKVGGQPSCFGHAFAVVTKTSLWCWKPNIDLYILYLHK